METTTEVSNKSVEQIHVDAVGPYGVKVGTAWYKITEPLTPRNFLRGQEYSVVTVTTGRGKKTIVAINGVSQPKESPSAMLSLVRNVSPSEKDSASDGDTPTAYGRKLSRYEVDKDRRISRQGLIQSCIISPALSSVAMTSLEDWWKAVVEYYEKGLALIEGQN